jgi:hypothetical protein
LRPARRVGAEDVGRDGELTLRGGSISHGAVFPSSGNADQEETDRRAGLTWERE